MPTYRERRRWGCARAAAGRVARARVAPGAARGWSRATALLVAAVAVLAAGPRAAPPVLPFADVQAGMRGEGRTVFAGTTVETFDVEILGKLPNVGPRQNLILARCSGGPLERTGVMAGMSGSPVFVDGRLIGAVAYSWGFAKDAIAGITPIEEMLAVAARDGDAPAARTGLAAPTFPDAFAALAAPERLEAFFDDGLDRLLHRSGAAFAPSIPLAVRGFGPGGLRAIAPRLERAGFLPLQAGGGSDASDTTAPPLEPGAAMGLKLVRGDIEIAATGTVTWVDDDGVLAFGHPLFGLGSVDLPLTAARVEALLPSVAQSAKMSTPLGEIGALREDRAAGVFARLGVEPRMIPVRLTLDGGGLEPVAYAFDVADDPLLAPLLLYASLNGILATHERAFGSATVSVREGSVIKMLDGEDVLLDNVYAGPTAFAYGTGVAAYILHLVMNNAWTQPRIAGINLILDYDGVPRTARIGRVSLSRQTVRAGGTFTATVVLRPYRGGEQVYQRELQIPEDTPPGELTLYVAGSQTVSRAEETDEPLLPHDLGHLVRLINQLRRNDRIYLLAAREDDGVLVEGERLPSLPPSAARLLTRPKNRGNVARVDRRGVFEDSIETDWAVEGGVRLVLWVEPS